MFGQGKPQGTFGGFSFGTPAGQTASTQVPASTAASSFSFAAKSQAQSGASSFQFSTPAPTTGSSGGFSFGAAQSTPASSGFSFGATPQQPASAATGGIKFGTSAPGTTGGLQFGSTPATLSQGAFSLSTSAVGSAGIKTAAAPAASTQSGFSFGNAVGTASSGAAGGFKLGPATTTTGTPMLSSLLGGKPTGQAPAPATTGGFMFSAAPPVATQAPAASTATPTFNVGGMAKSPGLTLGGGLAAKPSSLSGAATVPTAKTTSGGLSFATPIGTSSAGGLTVGRSSVATTSATPTLGFITQTPVATSSTATTTAVGLALGPAKPLSSLTTTTSVGIKLGPTLTTTPLTSTATTTTAGLLARAISTSTTSTMAGPVSTAAAVAPQMTYKQVEDHINKWAQELEEYEKTFLEQASQVNNWDRLLMENGEKITELNSNVETVKAEQKRLDQELDFIMSQQRDLEDMLMPLEESLKNASHVTGYEQHADHEREKTYKLAADIDGQLKQMVQDLKSIIDHLNLTSGTQKEGDDPIVQIAKILNAHTNSLQWIDQNSVLLQRKVDEVSRLSEARRKEQERNFRLAFE